MKILRLLSMLFASLPFSACQADGSALPREGATLVDTRSPGEFKGTHAKGALLLPHGQVRERAGKLLPDKDAPIDLYCQSGYRASLAMRALRDMGYSNVRNLGSLSSLRKAGVEMEAGEVVPGD